MDSFRALNILLKHHRVELNELYLDDCSKLVKKALKICEFKDSKSARMAVLKRIVDLKEEGISNQMRALNFSPKKQRQIKARMYEFVSEFYINEFKNILARAKNLGLLRNYTYELLRGVHKIGIELSKIQIKWQELVIDQNQKYFKKNFSSKKKALEFISKNKLYQKNADKTRADRIYGVFSIDDMEILPYALAFKKEFKILNECFEDCIKELKNCEQNEQDRAYTKYIKALKDAFCECENKKVIYAWQEAERAWMDCKGDIQIGHLLEYYEDAYTHSVALEWDVRLKDSDYQIDQGLLKSNIKDTFEQILNSATQNLDESLQQMRLLVHSNIDKTQLYICNPLFYYGADFNGLFSAQVVPNDEIVSKKYGKKIFAFVDFIHASTKARPFSKLSSEIFDEKFLDYEREILFKKPHIWKKVYEISTIGHEFGHILFIGSDTENAMNAGGEFKFIEEYKATTGGLVNFFLHEIDAFCLPVFAEVLRRAVSLIAWQKIDELCAYYCEGLIHLSLLFDSKVLSFNDEKLSIDFSLNAYKRFKQASLQNYQDLCQHYMDKRDASEFLARFVSFDGEVYLPKDEELKNFVLYYYGLYEKLANQVDLEAWQKWINA